MSVKVAIRAAGLALVLVAGQAIASEPDFEREARLADEIPRRMIPGRRS
jgi:short subunit fatty acids transporter